MALVEAGRVTEEQSKRWKALYSEDAPAEVAAFCLDLREATEADLSSRGPEALKSWAGPKPACLARGDCGSSPLINIGAQDAERFCTSVGKRPPTLIEWLWAAGGGAEDRLYPWGAAPPTAKLLNGCDLACGRVMMGDCDSKERKSGYCTASNLAELKDQDDGFGATAPVGSFPAGAGRWGHLDLAGNVAEFTADGGRIHLCGSHYAGSAWGVPISLHGPQCDGPGTGAAHVGVRCASEPATRRP